MTETRTISVLGATGSVGAATLDLIERAQPGAYDVVALTAHTNVDELVRLALKFRPTMVALADRAGADPESVYQICRHLAANRHDVQLLGSPAAPAALEVRIGAAA